MTLKSKYDFIEEMFRPFCSEKLSLSQFHFKLDLLYRFDAGLLVKSFIKRFSRQKMRKFTKVKIKIPMFTFWSKHELKLYVTYDMKKHLH